MTRPNSRALGIVAIVASLALMGCSNTPNQANIELRKQNQQLRDQIEDLNLRHDADQATIRGLQVHDPAFRQHSGSQLAPLRGLPFERTQFHSSVLVRGAACCALISSNP